MKSKKKNEEIWELVVWEYGTTLYTMASILQDHPPLRMQVGEEGLPHSPLQTLTHVPVMSHLCLAVEVRLLLECVGMRCKDVMLFIFIIFYITRVLAKEQQKNPTCRHTL